MSETDTQNCISYLDINECTDGTHDCHISAYCVNIPGSYNCSCKLSGYSYNGSICVGMFKAIYVILLLQFSEHCIHLFFFDEQDGVSTYKEQTLHQKYHDPPSLLLLIFHFCRNSKLLNKVSVLNKNLSNFYAPVLLCLSGRSRHALSLPFTPCGVE